MEACRAFAPQLEVKKCLIFLVVHILKFIFYQYDVFFIGWFLLVMTGSVRTSNKVNKQINTDQLK